jgi:hypothetical protein
MIASVDSRVDGDKKTATTGAVRGALCSALHLHCDFAVEFPYGAV